MGLNTKNPSYLILFVVSRLTLALLSGVEHTDPAKRIAMSLRTLYGVTWDRHQLMTISRDTRPFMEMNTVGLNLATSHLMLD